MAVSLTHFGEALIARMANGLRDTFLHLCKLREEADPAFLTTSEPIAHRDLALLPYGGIRFDGASRVDLAIRIARDRAVPFEVKLGTTRLSKSRIDDEWLCGCGFSHGHTRFRGNMMSILERKFPRSTAAGELQVALPPNATLNLTRHWVLIAKEAVLNTWIAQNRPAFSDHVRLLSFESIVDCYGGRDKFNALVREMLSFDYYDEWIRRTED
jgi:hypothetical protein